MIDQKEFLNQHLVWVSRLDYLQAKIDAAKDAYLHTDYSGFSTYKREDNRLNVEFQQQRYQRMLKRVDNSNKLITKAIEMIADDKQKAVLKFYYLDGLSVDDIAEEMGYSVRSIYRLKTKALKNIHIELGDAYGKDG